MEEGLWYVRDAGKVIGPLPALEVRMGIPSRFTSKLEVSKDRTTWRPAGAVPGLLPGDAAPSSTAAAGSHGSVPAGAPAGGPGGASRFGPPPADRFGPPPADRFGPPAADRFGPPAADRFGPPPDLAKQTRRVPLTQPMEELPTPDGWSGWWGTVLAVTVLVAWLMPMSGDALGLPGRTDGSTRWLFPWSAERMGGTSLGWSLLTPICAVLSLVIVFTLSGTARGAALLAVTGLTVLANLLFLEGKGGLDVFAKPAADGARTVLLIFLALFAGGVCAAVGNHLLKRSPTKGPGRLMAVIGGGSVVASFLIPIDGTPLIWAAFRQPGAWSVAWPVLFVLLGTLVFGLLGLRHLSTETDYTGRSVWMSRLGRALLVAPPIAITITLMTLAGRAQSPIGPSFMGLLLLMMTQWATFVGIISLIGVGLAASLEAAPASPRSRQASARTMANVFR